jgi:hypothetical protein
MANRLHTLMAKSCSLGSGQTSDKNNFSDGVTWTVSVERPAALLILSEIVKYCDDEELHYLNLTSKYAERGNIISDKSYHVGCRSQR